jgi:hypothetical protein
MQQLQQKYGVGRKTDIRTYARILDAVLTHPNVAKTKIQLYSTVSKSCILTGERLVFLGFLTEKTVPSGKRKCWIITQKGMEWLKLAQIVLKQVDQYSA